MQTAEWWKKLSGKVPTRCVREEEHWGTAFAGRFALARRLSEALEQYKSGTAPSDTEVIDLKRRLFCTTDSPEIFKHPDGNLPLETPGDFLKTRLLEVSRLAIIWFWQGTELRTAMTPLNADLSNVVRLHLRSVKPRLRG